MWASWPKAPIDTEYCCKTVVVEKPLFILSAINCPQREGMTIAMLHNIYKYKFPFSTVNKTVPTHKGITSVLVLQIRWNPGSAHPEANGQEKVFHSWRATSASHGPSAFQHSPAHKTHDSARCGAGTERRANPDDEIQLLAMLIILCNAPILMQSPIKKRFFFTIQFHWCCELAGNEISEALNTSTLKIVSKYIQSNRLLSKEQKTGRYCMGQESKFTFTAVPGIWRGRAGENGEIKNIQHQKKTCIKYMPEYKNRVWARKWPPHCT